MEHSKNQLVEYADITANVATTWLREGVVIPLEATGRNNKFDLVELQVARIVAAPYKEWGLPAAALQKIASLLRGELSVYKALGFSSSDQAIREFELMRLNGFITGDLFGTAKDRGGDYLQAVEDVASDMAKRAGYPDWKSAPRSCLTDDQFQVLRSYVTIANGIKDGMGTIAIGKSATDDWAISYYIAKDETDHQGQRSVKAYVPDYFKGRSMIVIELSRVFGGI